MTLCCGRRIPAGTEVVLHHEYSKNRVTVRCYPAVPYLWAGHSFTAEDGNTETILDAIKAAPPSGQISDLATVLPKACPVHKVRRSSIWFQGERP